MDDPMLWREASQSKYDHVVFASNLQHNPVGKWASTFYDIFIVFGFV